MFVKICLCDRLVCFADFFGMTLLAVVFLLPLSNSHLRVCLPTVFAAVLKFFLPLTTSTTSGATNLQEVNAHAFCSRDDIFNQKWTCCSPNNLCKCTESQIPVHNVDQYLCRRREGNLYLSWSNHLVASFRLEMNVGGFSKLQNKTPDTNRYKRYFSPLVFFKSL